MSAHCPTAYIGNPKLYVSPSPFMSISVLIVGLFMTRLNGSSIAKYHVSSAIAGISVCSTKTLRSGSSPTLSQSFTMPIVFSRIWSVFSAIVVKACMFATRK